jgi:hypothetical protein
MQVARKKSDQGAFQPGLDLYLRVRAGFVAQQSSLNAWCLANGIMRQNAKQALTGAWDGPKARELRERLIKASGIKK